MKVEGRWRRAIELADDGRSVIVLDQARLPYAIEWLRARRPRRRRARDPRHARPRRAADRRDRRVRRRDRDARRSGVALDDACASSPRRGRPRSTCAGRSARCARARRARRPRRCRVAPPRRSPTTMSPRARRSARHGLAADRERRTSDRSTCSRTATPAGSRPSTGAPRSRRSTRRTRPASPSTSGSTRPGRATRACSPRGSSRSTACRTP